MRKLTQLMACLLCLGFGFALGIATHDTELIRHFTDWRPGDVAASQTRGTQIVEAIEAFHHAKGVYPIGLYELSPEYLDEIPLPITGERFWRYETDRAGSAFSLSFAFNSHLYPVCMYSSEKLQWREDT